MPIGIPTDGEMIKQLMFAFSKLGSEDAAHAKAGTPLVIPMSIRKAMSHLTDMQKQHLMQNRNNQRPTHTLEQQEALKDLSGWILEVHHIRKGTPPPPRETWDNSGII